MNETLTVLAVLATEIDVLSLPNSWSDFSTDISNLLAFAEFERAMIIERTQAEKEIAKTKEVYKEGSPQKHSNNQIDHALSLLSINGGTMSYNQATEIRNISKSTFIRANNKINKCKK